MTKFERIMILGTLLNRELGHPFGISSTHTPSETNKPEEGQRKQKHPEGRRTLPIGSGQRSEPGPGRGEKLRSTDSEPKQKNDRNTNSRGENGKSPNDNGMPEFRKLQKGFVLQLQHWITST
jgi:hypothetical protein